MPAGSHKGAPGHPKRVVKCAQCKVKPAMGGKKFCKGCDRLQPRAMKTGVAGSR